MSVPYLQSRGSVHLVKIIQANEASIIQMTASKNYLKQQIKRIFTYICNYLGISLKFPDTNFLATLPQVHWWNENQI